MNILAFQRRPEPSDRLLAENAALDAQIADKDRQQRESNDAIYTKAVQAWFRKTEPR